MTRIQYNNALLNLRDKLYGFAYKLTADSDRANDLLQETMLKILKCHDKYRKPYNFKAWAYTIMKNTFINDYRREIKVKHTFNDSYSDFSSLHPMEKKYPAPDTLNNIKEIQQNIDALEDDYRIPFTMFFEGYKYKEIAEELEIPIGTVKSRIFFSRKKLKESLREYSIN